MGILLRRRAWKTGDDGKRIGRSGGPTGWVGARVWVRLYAERADVARHGRARGSQPGLSELVGHIERKGRLRSLHGGNVSVAQRSGSGLSEVPEGRPECREEVAAHSLDERRRCQ